MATVEKTVELIFAGVDQVTPALGTIRGNLRDLDNIVGGVAAPFAKVADAVLKTDAALAALVGGGLALAFKASSDFEAALIDLEKVVGDQPAALAQAKTAALELSNTYGVAATDVLGSFADFKQAGFDLADSMELTRTALDLVIAGEVDMDRASQILVQTLKGFNAPASDAQRVLDVLNETSNNYATNVEQLAEAMARAAPIAKLMGLSYEEVVGILTPMIEVFQNGEISGRAFNTIMLRLQDTTGPVADAMKTLGVAQVEANGAIRSGKDIFYDLLVAFQKLDPAQKTFIAGEIGGKEQAAKLAAALSDANNVLEITATAMDSAGSASAEVEKRLGSAQVAVDRFKTGFANLGIAVGDEFRDAAKGAIDGATDIENALIEAVRSGAFDDLSESLKKTFDDVGRYLSDVAKALPDALQQVDFTKLLDSLGRLGERLKGIFEGVDLRTPEGLAKALQFTVDSIASLIDVTAGMVSQLSDIVKAGGRLVKEFNGLEASTKEAIGGWLAIAKLVADLGVKIGLAAAALSDPSKAVIPLDQYADFEVAAASATDALNGQVGALAELERAAAATAPQVSRMADAQGTLVEAAGKTAEALAAEIDGMDAAAGASGKLATQTTPVAKQLDGLSKSAKGTGDALQKTADDSEDFRYKIAKLDNDLAKTALTLNVDLQKARIEAEVKTIEATFDSLDNTITSTGQNIVGLFGQLGGAMSSGNIFLQNSLQQAISQQQNAQLLATNAQLQLTNAQISALKARTKALQNGQAIIQIDGSGLAPSLELVMWEILEMVQVQVNQNAADFLLGVP